MRVTMHHNLRPGGTATELILFSRSKGVFSDLPFCETEGCAEAGVAQGAKAPPRLRARDGVSNTV